MVSPANKYTKSTEILAESTDRLSLRLGNPTIPLGLIDVNVVIVTTPVGVSLRSGYGGYPSLGVPKVEHISMFSDLRTAKFALKNGKA